MDKNQDLSPTAEEEEEEEDEALMLLLSLLLLLLLLHTVTWFNSVLILFTADSVLVPVHLTTFCQCT